MDNLAEGREPAETQASQKTKEADVNDLVELLGRLQKENQELRRKLQKARTSSHLAIAYYLVFIGGSALTVAIYLDNLRLVQVGLGVLIAGVIILAVRQTNHGRLIDRRQMATGPIKAAAISSMKALDRLLVGLDYRGKPVYLPPPTHQGEGSGSSDLSEARVFIPAESGIRLPPETETAGGSLVIHNPEGLSLTPPGQALADLFEEELGVPFSSMDLDELGSRLPSLLMKELGLVKGFQLDQLGNTIHVKIEGSALASLCGQIEEGTGICQTLGCPLTSAIAIILARTTHEPITIDAVETSEDYKIIEAWYGMLETETPPSRSVDLWQWGKLIR